MGNLKALALGLGIALAGTMSAQAALIIKADGVTVASSPTNGFTGFNGTIGSFEVNDLDLVGVNSFGGSGTLMDVGSLNVSATGAGSLVLEFIQTDLSALAGPLSFGITFSGILDNVTVTRSFYADTTNSGLATTLLATTTGDNASFHSAPVMISGPYSITEVITITATGIGAMVSTDDRVRVPEPMSLGLFGAALIGLGLVRRKTKRA